MLLLLLIIRLICTSNLQTHIISWLVESFDRSITYQYYMNIIIHWICIHFVCIRFDRRSISLSGQWHRPHTKIYAKQIHIMHYYYQISKQKETNMCHFLFRWFSIYIFSRSRALVCVWSLLFFFFFSFISHQLTNHTVHVLSSVNIVVVDVVFHSCFGVCVMYTMSQRQGALTFWTL